MGEQWVYYVPEYETVVIVSPYWVDDRGNTPVEWAYDDLCRRAQGFILDADEKSDNRTAIFIGEF